MIYFECEYLTIFIFSLAYLFSTFYLTPDLDLDSRIYKRWKLLKIVWCPYKELFLHRKASHHVVWGPVSLIGYFAFLILLLLYAIGAEIDYTDVRILIICAGFVMAIEAHIISDTVFKKKKKS